MHYIKVISHIVISIIAACLIHKSGGFSIHQLLLSNGNPTNQNGRFDSCQVPKNLSGYDYVTIDVTPEPEDTFEDLEPLNISFILQPVTGVTVHEFQEVLSNCVLSVRTLGDNITDPEFYETFIHGVLFHFLRIGSRGYFLQSRVPLPETGRHCDFVLLANPKVGNHSFIIKVTVADQPVMLRAAAEGGLMLMEKENWAKDLMRNHSRINFVFRVSLATHLDHFYLDWSNETLYRVHPSINT